MARYYVTNLNIFSAFGLNLAILLKWCLIASISTFEGFVKAGMIQAWALMKFILLTICLTLSILTRYA